MLSDLIRKSDRMWLHASAIRDVGAVTDVIRQLLRAFCERCRKTVGYFMSVPQYALCIGSSVFYQQSEKWRWCQLSPPNFSCYRLLQHSALFHKCATIRCFDSCHSPVASAAARCALFQLCAAVRLLHWIRLLLSAVSKAKVMTAGCYDRCQTPVVSVATRLRAVSCTSALDPAFSISSQTSGCYDSYHRPLLSAAGRQRVV